MPYIKIILTLLIIIFHYYVVYVLVCLLIIFLIEKRKLENLLTILEMTLLPIIFIGFVSYLLRQYKKKYSTFFEDFSFFNLHFLIELKINTNLVLYSFFFIDFTVIFLIFTVLRYFDGENEIFFSYILITIFLFFSTTFTFSLFFSNFYINSFN